MQMHRIWNQEKINVTKKKNNKKGDTILWNLEVV